MIKFKRFTKEDLIVYTKHRLGETKCGELISIPSANMKLLDSIENHPGKFILLGVSESIGIQANYGRPGAEKTWDVFLEHFLNMQANDWLPAQDILLIGHVDCKGVHNAIDPHVLDYEEKIMAYRKVVDELDDWLEQFLKPIFAAGKIPIVIGGGHNNAYPLIKAAAKGTSNENNLFPEINCINIDAHIDYRLPEGRHSGNAFRYAEVDGYLKKYAVVGAQKSFIPHSVWKDVQENPLIKVFSYESIILNEELSFAQAINQAQGWVQDGYTGLEIDLDAIANMPSSASSPVGLTEREVLWAINNITKDTKIAYLHLTEGAIINEDNIEEKRKIGKFLAQAVGIFTQSF